MTDYYVVAKDFNWATKGIKFSYSGYNEDLYFRCYSNEDLIKRKVIQELWNLIGCNNEFFDKITEEEFYNK